MSSQGHSPSMTYTSNDYQGGRAIPIPHSSVQSIPLRMPPTVYLGQQVHNLSLQHLQTYEHLKRERGSISSASTDSSPHAATNPRTDPIHIYSPTFSLSSQAEEGTREMPRSTRAYPNEYTRPSRSGMVEINAAYQQSHEEDGLSESPGDHVIWIVVCYHAVTYR